MPQLNFQDFAPQLFWLAISFVLLYLAMSRVALPRVGGILEERASRIAADLDTAAQLRAQTEKAIADYDQALADAKARAQHIARQAREEIMVDIEREKTSADRQINEKLAEADERITALKKSALTHIDEIASETSQALIARLLGKPADRSDLEHAIKEALGK